MAEPTEKDIERVINGYNRAIGAADYADSVVMEMQLVSVENYQMVWSNQYNGNFVPNAEQ